MTISAENISFSYGKEKILDDISFTLPSSSLTALLGRNGAGKSTLMRIMMGFLKPDSGRILIDNQPLDELKPKERALKIAYIPQFSPIAYPHTVRNLVLMGRAPSLPLFAKPGKKDEKIADKVLSDLGISHLSSRPIDEVSGGERQLAIIARALVQDAGILLLDEPASSLDYGNQLKVLETLSALKDKGYTLLFTTHSPDQALMASTSLMLMDENGRIEITDKEHLEEERLSRLYGRKLHISRVFTGRNERMTCVPE